MKTIRFMALLALTMGCAASSVPRLTLEQLAGQSESIVSGRVGRSWSSWDRSRQFVWTHHEIAIQEVDKGEAGRAMIVSEPGGTVDSTTMVVPGAVEFTPGENVVLFLYRTPIGYMRTVGWSQGKFRISADQRVHLAAPGEALPSMAAVEGMTLREFKRRLPELGKSR